LDESNIISSWVRASRKSGWAFGFRPDGGLDEVDEIEVAMLYFLRFATRLASKTGDGGREMSWLEEVLSSSISSSSEGSIEEYLRNFPP
jgi:hypothetical protein